MKRCFEKSKVVFAIISTLTVCFIFGLNYFEPWYADDFVYMKVINSGEPLRTLGDVILSQLNHYNLVNGRAVVHTIDQLFFAFGEGQKLYFDLANTAVTIFLVVIIYVFCIGLKVSNSFLLFEISFLFFCAPSVGEVLVWQTGACNYLWGSVILLIFFLPFLQYFISLLSTDSEIEKKCQKSKNGLLCSIGMGILGIVAGWTIEAGVAMVLFGIGLILLVQVLLWKTKQSKAYRPKAWEIVGFISAIIGFGLLFFAPGQRLRQQGVYEEVEQMNLLTDIVYRIARETFYMIIWLGPIIAATVVALMIVKRKYSYKVFLWKFCAPLLCCLMAFVGVYVMTFSVGYATRVLLTPLIFLLLAFGMFYKDIDEKYKNILSVVSVIFSTYVLTHLSVAIVLMYRTGEYINFGFNYVGSMKNLF